MALLKTWGCGLACLLLLAWFTPSDAYPNPEQRYFNYENSSPEELMDLYYRINNLLRLERNIQNEKRSGLDLGLNRGYSGSLQAKHLMALAAANDASGPGRKRRQADY